eukprot:scaffold50311_cov29-Phaeocystis_antarctica.AAC.2
MTPSLPNGSRRHAVTLARTMTRQKTELPGMTGRSNVPQRPEPRAKSHENAKSTRNPATR